MSREVPFCIDEICDICGRKGAFDFMGDLYCKQCLDNPNYFKQEEKE
jgi:hypothetical protein